MLRELEIKDELRKKAYLIRRDEGYEAETTTLIAL
jgi:hypothetical protein